MEQVQNLTQTQLIERLLEPQPTVIALEGGPCSGKSTLAREVEHQSAGFDRPIVVLPEAATEHITALDAQGISPAHLLEHDRPGWVAFERDVLGTIFARIRRALETYSGMDAIILADRADIQTYVTSEEHRQVLADIGETARPLDTLVDSVVFLPSVASESPEKYMELQATNGARYESSPESAAAVCAANLRAVGTHPEIEVAWGGDFETKIRRLAHAILHPEQENEIKQGVSGEQATVYVENARKAGNLLNIITMRQTYHQLGDTNFRLRASRTADGQTYYHFSVKAGEGEFRTELRRSLDYDAYLTLKAVPQRGKTLLKTRHVVLDPADSTGKRRLWYADRYDAPATSEWHFETGVETPEEVDELNVLYAGLRRQIQGTAQMLALEGRV